MQSCSQFASWQSLVSSAGLYIFLIIPVGVEAIQVESEKEGQKVHFPVALQM